MTAGLFLLASLVVSPPAPTVGEPVTISLEATDSRIVDVQPSPCFEVIRSTERLVLVRSFQPGPCRISVTTANPGEVPRMNTVDYEVRSVLEAGNPEPSPMRAPRTVPVPRPAWWSIGIASALALLAWLGVFVRPGIPAPAPLEPAMMPLDELRQASLRARGRSGREQQIMLADAVRRFLDRTDTQLRADRTTGETLRLLASRGDRLLEPVSLILRSGDRAKFSPFPVGDNPELLIAVEELLSLARPATDTDDDTETA